jgi:hypothetical protein
VGLLHEGVDIQLARETAPAPAARHFHVQALGDHHVLRSQQSGPVGG